MLVMESELEFLGFKRDGTDSEFELSECFVDATDSDVGSGLGISFANTQLAFI